jgi:hypothetical protein
MADFFPEGSKEGIIEIGILMYVIPLIRYSVIPTEPA